MCLRTYLGVYDPHGLAGWAGFATGGGFPERFDFQSSVPSFLWGPPPEPGPAPSFFGIPVPSPTPPMSHELSCDHQSQNH